MQNILTQNIQEFQDTRRRQSLQIIGVDENEYFQFKGPANIFNKITEENIPILKKEMPEGMGDFWDSIGNVNEENT